MYLKDKKIRLIEQDGSGYYPIHPGKIWAYYRHISSKEKHDAGISGFVYDALFVINWREDVYEGEMYVEYNSQVYRIEMVDRFEGYKGNLKLHCSQLLRGINIQPYE